MISIFAMLLCAWIQTRNDNTPAWVYAAVLAIANTAIGLFTGGDLVNYAIMGGMLFLFLWLYYFLLDYFSESVIVWWAILILGAAALFALPLMLLSVASNIVGA